jgi:hypothetical protein
LETPVEGGLSGDPLITAEAARNLAVLIRRAGWHEPAMSIALAAAASPGLRGGDPRLAAERGLLLQCAAYTAARAGDRDQMQLMPASLPTTERRVRFWTDTARAYGMWGRREDCIQALLGSRARGSAGHPRAACRPATRSAACCFPARPAWNYEDWRYGGGIT